MPWVENFSAYALSGFVHDDYGVALDYPEHDWRGRAMSFTYHLGPEAKNEKREPLRRSTLLMLRKRQRQRAGPAIYLPRWPFGHPGTNVGCLRWVQPFLATLGRR